MQSGPPSLHDALLQACGLQFLFKALARSSDDAQRDFWEEQILRLIGGMVPCCGGSVLMGPTEGDVPEECVALPLYVRENVAGLLAVWFPPEEVPQIPVYREILSAVATLATAALESVTDLERLHAENVFLRAQVGPSEVGMIGDSPAIRRLIQMIARVAPQQTSVLVQGESGTGKEIVARALHRLSPRAGKPFIAINCAALSETLLESELFGYEKGAFTGAFAQKKGKLETAEGGTVFLDEIGELAPSLQAKLLRVLQQREFERVGGTRTIKLDVRVVAATNRDLAEEVRRGKFREDLYHRLNVVALHIAPLRERPGDVLLLAAHFLQAAASRCGRRVTGFAPETERYLEAYEWPGNVRELENAIERAVVMGESELVQPGDLPEAIVNPGVSPASGSLAVSLSHSKRDAIITAWRETKGDHDATAARLNIHPNSLRRMIRVLGLKNVL